LQPDLEQSLAQMKATWMMGGTAQNGAPQNWIELTKDSHNAELTLLALTGQAIDICFVSEPSNLNARADLPSLSLPTLPETFRSNFRRALTSSNLDKMQSLALIRLIANRGYSVHPMDWMPSASADVPDIYAPWLDWRAKGSTGETRETLKLEEWDAWMPAERLAKLKTMRRKDPEAALAMIAAKASDEPAEKRLALVDILWIGLSEKDTAFLQSLSTDRSGKVKLRAQQLLARLGESENDAEASDELADFLELAKSGFLSRKRQLKAKKLKTKTQFKRRAELFSVVSLSNLAASLKLSISEIIEFWSVDEKDIAATTELVQMVVDTGPDSAVLGLAHRLKAQKEIKAVSLAALSTRLNKPQRVELMREILNRQNDYFVQAILSAEDSLGNIPFDDLKNTPGLKSLMSDLKSLTKKTDNRRLEFVIDQQLTNISLLSNQDAAKSLLEFCVKLELPVSTLRFNLLTFNAALTPYSNK